VNALLYLESKKRGELNIATSIIDDNKKMVIQSEVLYQEVDQECDLI
jgi:hypothetical protein